MVRDMICELELEAQRASWPVAPAYDTRIFMGCPRRGGSSGS